MLKVARSLPEIFLPLVKFDYSEDNYEITQSTNIFREFKQNTLLIGIPGAFIPTIQYKLLAEYRRHFEEILAVCKVEKIAVLSINDPFVMKCFAEEIDAEEKFMYISDFNAECTSMLGADFLLPELGKRSKPFRCVVKNGEITHWVCDEDWKPTSQVRVFRLLRDFLDYPAYPQSIYPDRL